ncbi:MAG: type II toxin-antitoxin system HicB family antitoxin [Acidobacteriota bacterium]|jgi:antitoxin HicB|nr:type II toxin-antitoxin system HicB family antitoxin [Acidobacteriota bacterium]
MNVSYPFSITQEEEGGYSVQCLDISNVFTCGYTIEECLFNASEVLTGMLDQFMADDTEFPAPTQGVEDAYYVAPDAKTQAAVLVRLSRGKRTMSEIARTLETSWPSAARLEDPRHWPNLRQLDRVAAALGKQLVLSFEDVCIATPASSAKATA